MNGQLNPRDEALLSHSVTWKEQQGVKGVLSQRPRQRPHHAKEIIFYTKGNGEPLTFLRLELPFANLKIIPFAASYTEKDYPILWKICFIPKCCRFLWTVS